MSDDPNGRTPNVGDASQQRQGQPQRNQQQAGRQATGGPQAQPSPAGQPRAAAGHAQESVVDAIQRPSPKNFVKGITGIMAVMGVLLGVGLFLVSEIGGRSLLPGIAQELSGVDGLEEGLAFSHQLTTAYIANELAIYLAFLMAPLFGLLVAFKMEDTKRAKMGAAGVGVALGTIVFTFVVVMVASLIAPTGSDLMAVESAAPTDTNTVDAQEQIAEGMDFGSIYVGNTFLNSALIGGFAGLAAASIVYFDDKFFQ